MSRLAVFSLIVFMVVLSACQTITSPTLIVTEEPTLLPQETSLSVPQVETLTVAIPSSQGAPNPENVKLISGNLPKPHIDLIANQPLDTTSGPRVKGMPEHIRVTFGENPSVDYPFGKPVLTIIPIESYIKMWLENGLDVADIQFKAIQELIKNPPANPPTAQVPVLPFEAVPATIDLVAHYKILDTDILHGFRFIARESQGLNPLTNSNLFYIYVGLTADNQYLVTMMVPVTSNLLPTSSDEFSAAELDQIYNDFSSYLSEKAAMLDSTALTDWSPDIDSMDKIIQSLDF